jgi:hypothetical protein
LDFGPVALWSVSLPYFVVLIASLDGLLPPLTILTPVQLDDEIVNRLTLRTDLPQIDPGTSKSSTADVVSILLFLGLQSVKVWFDGQRDDSGWVVGQILL